MKELINMMKYDELSQFKDVRVHLQVLLDFFDSLISSAISIDTIIQIDTDCKEKASDQGTYPISNYFTYLKRHEFYIMQAFAEFLRYLISKDSELQDERQTFAMRIAISLLRKRKAFDRLFYGRNLIEKKLDDKQVQLLTSIIVDFSQEDPETLVGEFVSRKSPIMNKNSPTTTSPSSFYSYSQAH